MLIKKLELENFLSFGKKASIDLKSLNVIIGANGAGKSNLIEAISLLNSAPTQITSPIREGGGISDWLWKGSKKIPIAGISALIDYETSTKQYLKYSINFTSVGQRFEIVDERIEDDKPVGADYDESYFYYHFNNGRPYLNVPEQFGGRRSLRQEDVSLEDSILAQRKDPDLYPELTFLGQSFSKVFLYREWSIGRYTVPRLPQKADLPNNYLLADASNLGLVLNRLCRYPEAKRKIVDALKSLKQGIEDYNVIIEGGTVHVFIQKINIMIPATRLSDGTLRFLCLLAILCNPEMPPMVCIEEPELGLHPDMISTIAKLLKEAAEKSQIIITTHSEMLVDAFTDTPEDVIVAENVDGQTELKRLSKVSLENWLKDFSLGQIWMSGEIGGTRW